jgi:hypothetical protein
MYLAATDILWARWTDDIHEEWTRAVRDGYPDITQQQVDRIRRSMDLYAPDSIVTGYKQSIPAITMPDPNDRHVLAAAIVAGADVIATFNLNHFPDPVLAPYGIEAVHPDELIDRLLDLDSEVVFAAVKQDRESLKKPPKSVDEYLKDLVRAGLPQTSASLAMCRAKI